MKYGEEIKNTAKKSLKNHYFRNIIVVFIASVLLVGGYDYGTRKVTFTIPDNKYIDSITIDNNITDVEIIQDSLHILKEKQTKINHKYTKGVLANIVNEITASDSLILGMVNAVNKYIFSGKLSSFIIMIGTTLISFLFFVFLQNVIQVGKARYFLEHRVYFKTKMERLLFPYRVKRTLHLSWILFLKYCKEFLWRFTIIGGFIKHYEYLLIPYILAENPNINAKEAFRLSADLMEGEKKNVFHLDLSLFGWILLDYLSLGLVGIFFYKGYKECIKAEIYAKLRKEKKEKIKNGHLLNDEYLFIEWTENARYLEKNFSIPLNKQRKWLKVDYFKEYSLSSYILLFFVFSIFGWIWEVFLTLRVNGAFVNKGTLYGPWLPIYGVGGICILFFLKNLRSKPERLFLASFLLCGVIEYSAGWYLETFLHTRYWDYHGYFLNLQGRICLEFLILFGIGGCAFTYIFAPILDNLFQKVKAELKYILCFCLLGCFMCDQLVSHIYPRSGENLTYEIEEKEK